MSTHVVYTIVGVVPNQPAGVVTTAAMFAEQFGAELICASVNAGRYTVERYPDGTVESMPIDPDLADSDLEVFDPELEGMLAHALNGCEVRWSVRALAGGPAQELARLADELDAAMIVVGTRRAGFKASVHEFFSGSVAVQLAHRQHRPVLVVPVNPVKSENDLPWVKLNP